MKTVFSAFAKDTTSETRDKKHVAHGTRTYHSVAVDLPGWANIMVDTYSSKQKD